MEKKMETTTNEEQITLRKVLPEIALIAWLLILRGIPDSLRAAAFLSNAVQQFTHSSRASAYPAYNPHLLIFEIAGDVLSLASIIVGIGLLRVLPWARRGAMLLLLAGMAVSCLPLLFPDLHNNGHSVVEVLKHPVVLLLPVLHYAILLVFVASLRLRQEWDEQGHPGFLTEIAERVLRRLPKMVSPLAALVALLFLYWVCIQARYIWVFTFQSSGHAFSASMIIFRCERIMLFFGYLLAGLGLLRRWNWARYLGIAIVAVNIIFEFTWLPLPSSIIHSLHQPGALLSITFSVMQILFAISGYAVVIDFLARSWQRPLPPTNVDRLLCDEG